MVNTHRIYRKARRSRVPFRKDWCCNVMLTCLSSQSWSGKTYLCSVISSVCFLRGSAHPDVCDACVWNALQELNDRKRLATSGANTARAYTVQNGTCNFPFNFTGCQDLARTKAR